MRLPWSSGRPIEPIREILAKLGEKLMPAFDDDLNVGGKIATGGGFTTAGTVTFYPPDGFAWFHIDNGPGGGRPTGRLRISGGANPGDAEMVSVVQDGNVGIGTPNPRAKLEVNGDILVTGDIVLQNADCAEDFEIADSGLIEAGMVMTLNDNGRLEPGRKAYDTRVAGVISGASNIKPGLILGRIQGSSNRLPIALAGKVYCWVDADKGPVQVGDLLTTADTRGNAMKALDRDKAFGAVIGKALQALHSGRELIQILVALQ